MLYQFHGGMEEAGISFAGRFKGEKGNFTANASPMGNIMLSYLHKVNEKVHGNSVYLACVCACFVTVCVGVSGHGFGGQYSHQRQCCLCWLPV